MGADLNTVFDRAKGGADINAAKTMPAPMTGKFEGRDEDVKNFIATDEPTAPLSPDGLPQRPDGGRILVTAQDHRIEGSADYYWPVIRAGLRAGLISGFNLLGGPSIPNATLEPSPYVTGTVSAEAELPYFNSMLALTGSYLYMRSSPGISLPYAGNTSQENDEHAAAGHIYGDLIGIIRLAQNFAVAPFAAVEIWALSSSVGEQLWDANAGLAAAWQIAPAHSVHAWSQAEWTHARADSYRNYEGPNQVTDFNSAVYLEGVQAGADYKYSFAQSDYVKPWLQYTNRVVYQRVDTGTDLGLGPVKLGVAGRYQQTESPWFENEHGGAAGVQYEPLPGFSIGMSGSIMERSGYEDNALPFAYNVGGSLAWTPGKNGSGVQIKGSILKQVHDDPEAETIQSEGRRYSQITGSYQEAFYWAVRNSANFDEFGRNLSKVSYTDSDNTRKILQAVSLFTAYLKANNANPLDNEGKVLNADSTEEIYSRFRGSYLSGSADKDPMVNCLGASQAAAQLAINLGQHLGVDIKAAPVTVETKNTGHSVPMIRVPGEGIVFVDWGLIIPTKTFDPKAALAVYQGIRGSVALFHKVGDPENRGAYVGRIYSEQGKALYDATTLHGDSRAARSQGREHFNDEARGSDITPIRSLDALYRSLVGPW